MSTVMLITDDEAIRAEVQQCAQRSGIYVTMHDTVPGALSSWPGADLVLLGADQIYGAAAHVPLPEPKPRDVIATGGEDPAPWELAAAVGADYVVVLPIAAQWLTGQLDNLPDHPVAQLKRAGFHIGYADPAEVARYSGLSSWRVRQYSYDDAKCPFVTLDEIARGECKHGQSNTMVRSNYRTLRQAFPDVFVDVSYSNVDVLGAMVCDLTPELVDILIGLREQYPLFDDSDCSDLEEEDITESWSRWVSQELYSRVREHVQDVWIAMPDCQVEDLFWEVVQGLGYRPEHDGRDVHWDLDRLAGPFAARLMAEFRKTFRPDPVFEILTRPASRRPAPRFAVVAEGFPLLLAQAWSRFSAQTQLWAHQRAWVHDISHARTVQS